MKVGHVHLLETNVWECETWIFIFKHVLCNSNASFRVLVFHAGQADKDHHNRPKTCFPTATHSLQSLLETWFSCQMPMLLASISPHNRSSTTTTSTSTTTASISRRMASTYATTPSRDRQQLLLIWMHGFLDQGFDTLWPARRSWAFITPWCGTTPHLDLCLIISCNDPWCGIIPFEVVWMTGMLVSLDKSENINHTALSAKSASNQASDQGLMTNVVYNVLDWVCNSSKSYFAMVMQGHLNWLTSCERRMIYDAWSRHARI